MPLRIFLVRIGVAAGSTNSAVIGPQPLPPTPIWLTATSASVTCGSARIAIPYLLPRVPQS